MPGVRMSQTTQVMPLCLGASGSVRTRSSCRSATWAYEVHVFWPVTTRWSPSISALVLRPARSDPAPGSENPWHQTFSPLRICGRYSAFCSSVPLTISVGPPCMLPTNVHELASVKGGSALANSSYQIICWMSESPRPPNSAGQLMPAQPPSNSVRCQARSNSRISWPSGGRSSVGRLLRNQSRASSRNACSSAVRSRFMQATYRAPDGPSEAGLSLRGRRFLRAAPGPAGQDTE